MVIFPYVLLAPSCSGVPAVPLTGALFRSKSGYQHVKVNYDDEDNSSLCDLNGCTVDTGQVLVSCRLCAIIYCAKEVLVMAFAIPVLTTANNEFPMSLHNEEADVVQDART